jgi:DNA primase
VGKLFFQAAQTKDITLNLLNVIYRMGHTRSPGLEKRVRKHADVQAQKLHLYLDYFDDAFSKIKPIRDSIAHRRDRGTKLFVDPSQNDYADTLASVYSVRPYKHPTVSTPLEWKEVKDKLDPGKFTMDTVMERMEKKGDLFMDLLDCKLRASNSKQLKTLLLQ